jgi:hypothetical protein
VFALGLVVFRLEGQDLLFSATDGDQGGENLLFLHFAIIFILFDYSTINRAHLCAKPTINISEAVLTSDCLWSLFCASALPVASAS